MEKPRYANTQDAGPLRALPGAALREVWREGYKASDLRADIMAGLVVGVVALPLAMALGIAVGVPPQHGLYTAIIAGGLVALLGGSRTQVSGPTAAFVVILAPIVSRYGMSGLLVSGFLAGLVLIGMGLLRMGKLIQFIPHPVTTGFTAGIATVIAALQLKDLFGLHITGNPEHFAERLASMVDAAGTASPWELAVGSLTLALLLLLPKLTKRVPAPLMALSAAAVVGVLLSRLAGIDVATIGSRFHAEVGGHSVPGIPQLPPLPMLPWLAPGPGGQPLPLTLATLRELLPSVFAIAMLGAIESLLSAVVADGMARTKHNPDAELLALGIGNVVTPFFGGIPATGAIARTATNIRSGARSPIAAAVHALTVLGAVVILAPALSYLPMSALAALLLLVAWNMSEVKHFIHTVRVAPRSDVAVLLTCFGLTVFTDMVIGVGVGMGLATMLFMRRMAEVTEAHVLESAGVALPGPVPPGVMVYHISGALFFGAAQKAMGALNVVSDQTRVVVFWLDQVPAMDATGLVALESAIDRLHANGLSAVLYGLRPQPRRLLEKAGLLGRQGLTTAEDPSEALRVAGLLAAKSSAALAPIPDHYLTRDYMHTDVATVEPTASLREVVESMLAKTRRAVPVVHDGRVVGIITNGDLVARGGLGARLELLRGLAWSDVNSHLQGLQGAAKTATDIMTPDPRTILPSTPLREVADIMTKDRLKRLPVVDERGALVGILSRLDLLQAAAGQVLPRDQATAAVAPPGAHVGQIMRTDIPTVPPDSSLAEVLAAVVSSRLHMALVVDKDRHVVGLVTDAELVDRMAPAMRPGLLRSIMQQLPFGGSAGEGGAPQRPAARASNAAQLMAEPPPQVGLETPISSAIAVMLQGDRKLISVIDSEGRLLGIVDRADLLRGIATTAEAPDPGEDGEA